MPLLWPKSLHDCSRVTRASFPDDKIMSGCEGVCVGMPLAAVGGWLGSDDANTGIRIAPGAATARATDARIPVEDSQFSLVITW